MRKSLATVLGVLVGIVGLSGIAQAQNWIQVQGRVQAVDCGANTLALNAVDGTHTFPMAPNAQVFINSTPAGFCTLGQYIGSFAAVSVTAIGSQMVAGRVDVLLAATPALPPVTVGTELLFVPTVLSQAIVFVPVPNRQIVFVPTFPSQAIVFVPVPNRQIVFVPRFPIRHVVFVPRFPNRQIVFFP